MAYDIPPFTNDPAEIVQALLQLLAGRGNFAGSVTLTPNAATTVVSFENCSKDCEVFLSPRSVNAAAALATTYILPANIVQGGFTISHQNAVSTDRVFGFECVGG